MKKFIFIFFISTGCISDRKKESSKLDVIATELQKQAFWHREFYFKVLKFSRAAQDDSVSFYEKKMDSVLALYTASMYQYDSLTKIK